MRGSGCPGLGDVRRNPGGGGSWKRSRARAFPEIPGYATVRTTVVSRTCTITRKHKCRAGKTTVPAELIDFGKLEWQ